MKNIVIIGAGVAGLSLGYLLSQNGARVAVLEKEVSVGGLARSFHYGDYVFDIGPHRFHTEEPHILAFIKEVLAENMVTIPRSSGVWMFGKYHDWPLNRSTIFKLPIGVMLGVLSDLLVRKISEGDSFEDYISNMYGKTLYEQFFKPYTEKFLRYPPNIIHSDWAKTGIDRSVIDNRAKVNTLPDVIKRAVLPKPVNTQFLYPLNGGIANFSQRLAENIERNNGQILLNTTVDKIEQNGDKLVQIVCNGTKFYPDTVIWTAPIPVLCSLLNLPAPDLHYLSAICYNVEINGPPKRDYQWCYYGQKEVIFNRISIPKMFSENNAPKGKTGINVEVTCMEGDSIWQEPEKLTEPVKEDMVKVKLIEKYENIDAVHIERIPNVYPIYTMDYGAKLDAVMEQLRRYSNLVLLGRTGTFWYNNMDHSIAGAMRCAANILNGENLNLRFDWLKK
ncbi:MAG: FAD-dependent oxidoreductase [bacterium]